MKIEDVVTPSGLLATLTNAGVRYRHYLITIHALHRFTERISEDLSEIFNSIDAAVLVDWRQTKDVRIQSRIRRADTQGGYVLMDPERSAYFFMAINPDASHAVKTVMTQGMLTQAPSFL